MGAADEEEPLQGLRGGEEKIFVSVRLRPLNEKEISQNDVSDWECISDDTIIYRNNLPVSERSMYPTAYSFDRVFRPDCSTRQVYEEGAKEVALSVVSGINSSVFAYGQTSSGKTYTMSGITGYTVADIYAYIDRHKEREFCLKFSAMEIYNESVRDLLSTDTTPLRLLDDPERGTVVERLKEETLRDWKHFRELLAICEAQRQIGETSLNETSSRSHQILRLTIESTAREFLGKDKSSTLLATVNFIDLAGSERASQSSSAGMRLKEGCHINRSLLTLGTVIRKLSKGRNGHVPFRDSKLTRILQSSLGGNARTAIICTMSPARTHVEQSRNTLLFASCAKEVATNAQVNVVMSDKALVKQLQRELARLGEELRSSRPNSITSDSIAALREKDMQIEKLMREVTELTQQLDHARAQVADLRNVAENDTTSTVWEDPDQYPKLRVRNSCRSEHSPSYSFISEDPHSVDVTDRSFGASQCSDGHSSGSSDENYIQLAEFAEDFRPADSSPDLSIRTAKFDDNDLPEKDAEEQTHENSDNMCKEVQCVSEGNSSTRRHANPNVLQSSPNRYPDTNMPSPDIEIGDSGLIEESKDGRENEEFESSSIKEQKELNSMNSTFIIPSPERPSPWLMQRGISRSRSLNLIRSRSCRARLMDNMSMCWFEQENKVGTPPIGFEKDFIGRPQSFRRKLPALSYGQETEMLSRTGDQNSMDSVAAPELKESMVESLTDSKSIIDGNANEDKTLKADDFVPETKENTVSPAKNVKDVGLDPIQDDLKDVGLDPIQYDVEGAQKWPLEFKRIQLEIIELWDSCNVSLVHRSYFFLLFKGDPTDSFYMEVENRRLSFLKDTFSKGNKTMVDGRILTPSSSLRALNQERQMLSREMQKKLSREERENLFLKWGISLSSNNRRLQLAHCLWSKTSDMDHITESATLVAKLVGFQEQEHAMKEMLGLLHVTPTRSSWWRAPSWKRSFFYFL